MKHAILLAAYGAGGVQGTHTLNLFERKVRQEFPDSSIRWAFTSMLMRNRLAAERKKTDSVKKALCRLGFEKYTHVTVQSLHLIPGTEYEELLSEIQEAQSCGAPPNINTGLPLLSSPQDVTKTAQAMTASLPEARRKDEAVIWVGHGTSHDSWQVYVQLTEAAQAMDDKLFVGTIAGRPDIHEIMLRLQQQNIHSAWLMPLLSVVGKHAREDIAGSGKGSWNSTLRANGIECKSVTRGAIEYEGFADIWLRHLQEASRNW